MAAALSPPPRGTPCSRPPLSSGGAPGEDRLAGGGGGESGGGAGRAQLALPSGGRGSISAAPGPQARGTSRARNVERPGSVQCAPSEGQQTLGTWGPACRLHVRSAHQSAPVFLAEGAGAPRGE